MSDLFPPFAPDAQEARRRRFKPVPLRMLVPNLITLVALCLGLTAVRLAFEGRLEPAVIAIVVAAALDGIDGRVARLLKGTSRFGAELDSLADFVNFGVTPALVLHWFVLQNLKSIGWIVALLFAISAALRLARFNVMIDDPNRPEWTKNFFVGMAAPAGAITSLLPIYLHFLGVPTSEPALAPLSLIYVFGIGFLMVSTVPTFSGKNLGRRIPRQWVLPIFVATVAFFGLLVSFPFEILTLGTLLFLGSIPFSIAQHRRFERADEERAEESQAREPATVSEPGEAP
jgi:CDP-diacylglycerol---serine O-phosphatidyltransferase